MSGGADRTHRPVVTVVGLGPAGPELMTVQAQQALRSAPAVLLRTSRHPAAEPLLAGGARALDRHYESAASFDEVYAAIVDEVVAEAGRRGGVAYAVPGSPLVLERSVQRLRADGRVRVAIVTGLSFLDLAWDRLGIDPVSAHVRLVDAEELALAAPGDPGPLLLGHAWSRAVLSEVKLSVEDFPAEAVTVLHHLGLPDEQVLEVPFEDLDRSIEPDHLTCLYVPSLGEAGGAALAALVETVRVLRQRCPWDREQTHASLVRHLIEESYEVVEAIEELGELAAGEVAPGAAGAPDPAVLAVEPADGEHLEEELGDLLVQVLFHARLAEEEGLFDLAAVARAVNEKLVRRHPHVFGDPAQSGAVATAGAVEGRWEQIKQLEKGRTSIVEGIPAGLPALLLASKLERKLKGVGLGAARTAPPADELLASVRELAAGAALPDGQLGELLLAIGRLAAAAGADPEESLRRAAKALARRVTSTEERLAGAGVGLSTAAAEHREAAWRDSAQPPAGR